MMYFNLDLYIRGCVLAASLIGGGFSVGGVCGVVLCARGSTSVFPARR